MSLQHGTHHQALHATHAHHVYMQLSEQRETNSAILWSLQLQECSDTSPSMSQESEDSNDPTLREWRVGST